MATVIVQILRFTDEHQPGFAGCILTDALGTSCAIAAHPLGLVSKAATACFTVLLAQWVLGNGPA